MDDIKITEKVLSDLININDDRITRYKKAVGHLPAKAEDLKAIFVGLIDQSDEFKKQLLHYIGNHAGNGQTDMPEKTYRTPIDLDISFGENDMHTLLESCEAAEVMVQDAYQKSQVEERVSIEAQALIDRQKTALIAAHDQVKKLVSREKTKS